MIVSAHRTEFAPNITITFDSNVGFVPRVEDGESESKCIACLRQGWSQPSDEAASGSAASEGKGGNTTSLPCTAVDWTCTGSSVVAAYGATDEAGWSKHRGGVAAWNLMRRSFDAAAPATSKPDHIIEYHTSIMAVACHPEHPSLIAGGSFLGEVVVWDTNKEEQEVARSTIDEAIHREAITSLQWFKDLNTGAAHLLASLSADGRLNIWSLDNNLAAPVQAYRLTPPGRLADKHIVLGGASMSFFQGSSGASGFVVGTEGGAVLRCSRQKGLTGKLPSPSPAEEPVSMEGSSLPWHPAAAAYIRSLPAASKTRMVRHVETHAHGSGARLVDLPCVFASRADPELAFPSPAVFRHAPHSGPVRSCSTSPFHRALFATGGLDGRVCVYSSLLRQPPLVLEPVPASVGNNHVGAVAWSRKRPFVLAAGGGDGMLHVFDLLSSPSAPVLSLPPASYGETVAAGAGGSAKTMSMASGGGGNAAQASHQGVLAAAFNPRLGKLVACGDSTGALRVWRLGWRLSEEQPNEAVQLNQYMRLVVSGGADDTATS